MAKEGGKMSSDQLNCSVCLEGLSDPRQLQCGHIFCLKCLVNLVVQDHQGELSLPCPTCLQPTAVPARGIAALKPPNYIPDKDSTHSVSKFGHPLHQDSSTTQSHSAYRDSKSSLSTFAVQKDSIISIQATKKDSGSSMAAAQKESGSSVLMTQKDSNSIVVQDISYQTSSSLGVQGTLGTSPPSSVLQDLTHSSPTLSAAGSLKEDSSDRNILSFPDPSQCYLAEKSLQVVVGEKSTVVLNVVSFEGLPFVGKNIALECHLVSEMLGVRSKCAVKQIQRSRYEVSLLPIVKGRHLLYVKAEGHHIRGSPFSVAANSPIVQFGPPLMTIERVEGPWGVAVAPRGEVVVTEWNMHCVSVFSPSGRRLRSFGVQGSKDEEFTNPRGVAVDDAGSIYVIDNNRERVQKFTFEGKFVQAVGSSGSGPLQFIYLRAVAFNQFNKKLYIAEGSDRIQVSTFWG